MNFREIRGPLAKGRAWSESALFAGPRQIPRPAEMRRVFGMTGKKIQMEPLLKILESTGGSASWGSNSCFAHSVIAMKTLARV
jgi:hypothetical protein